MKKIFRRDISEKTEIQRYITYEDNETKIKEFIRTTGTMDNRNEFCRDERSLTNMK